MAIAVANRTTPVAGANSTTPSLTLSGAVTVGNVLYVAITINTATDSTPSAVELGAAGSGKTFAQVAAINNAANVRTYIYRRVLVSGDSGTTVTATLSVARNNRLAALELSGVDTTTPEDLVGAGATGTSISNENTGTTGGTAASGAYGLGVVGSRNGHLAAEDTTNETPGGPWTAFNTSAANAGSAQVSLAMFELSTIGGLSNSIAAATNSPSSDPFAGVIITIKPAAGGGSAPTNTAAGAVTPTGNQIVGTVLTATKGTWTGSPTSYTYEWLRDGTTVVQTTGPTASTSDTYTTVSGDDGHAITCRVTATNGSGSSSPTTDTGSASVGNVPSYASGGGITPSGSQPAGTVLTASAGTFDHSPSTYTYVWKAGATTVRTNAGTASTSDTYTPSGGDVGQTITCLVSATNAWGTGSAHTFTGGSVTAAPEASGPALATSTSQASGTSVATGQGSTWIAFVEIAPASNIDTQGAPIQWVDVTPYVRSISTKRGRQNELARYEAGTITLVLDNRDNRFTPQNASSPYYPNLTPGVRVRVYAQWSGVEYPVALAFADSWPPSWPGQTDAVVQLDATDALKMLNLADVAAARPAESTGDRVVGVLQGIPLKRSRVAAGTVACDADAAISSKALAYLQAVADTEDSGFFTDARGGLVFEDRYFRYRNRRAATAVFSDNQAAIAAGSAIGYTAISPSFDDTNLWNQAVVTPKTGDAITLEDVTSRQRYGRRTLQRSSLSSDQSENYDLAGHLSTRWKDADLRFDSITVDTGSPGAQWHVQFALDIDDRVTVSRTYNGVTTTIDCYVEAVSHAIKPSGPRGANWKTTYQLSLAKTETFWELGDATRGVLDSTTVLGY